ncbi:MULTISPECIES: thiolase family protein [Pseudomonadaceae]|uniref:Acetyl-CoA acetyltransferases n=1 Tax=Halopseudomonas litoralis TaxID=797277 RepID=A0A1H1VZ26_9GAMM|nr:MULTISPECIES: thiolase family protein [Pseudomonadaceae]SDS90002.1 acetyl-CoA acetyltransferases [Halopseudomonas litoralis]
MNDIVIVEAVRTPVGRFRGSLAGVRADHLGSLVINELLQRTGLSAEQIDDVIFGCVTQIGEQSANIARTALLGAGWPASVPGLTLDRKCGSGEAAVHAAMGAIAAGAADIVVAGGAENMSRVPMGSNRDLHGEAFGWKATEHYELTSQGEAAERVAEKWQISREELDAFALESHRRAAAAVDAGHFDREIVPVPVGEYCEKGYEGFTGLFAADETIRRDTSLEKLATLKTSFRPENGRVTAGNSSQISDGAAALLLMSAETASRLGLRARARIKSITTVGADPTLMLTGPISATYKILAKSGLQLADIDLFEINEAFASVPIAWLKETGAPADRLNVNGGAVALGHPLGASGARIMTTMLSELERRNGRYALQAICCAGGMGTATLIERLP